MKRNVLQPMNPDERVIVQFSEPVLFDKLLAVTVPGGYTAYVFADEKAQFRIEPCSGKKIVSSGRELLGKTGRVAFVRTKPLPPMAWGFGNIQVNNERLKEAYRIGANGKYGLELSQPTKILSRFAAEGEITADALRARTISAVKTVGSALLGSYFAGTEISVFEIASCMQDFRTKFLQALQAEPVFAEMGLAVKDLTVDGIHVPEEDLEGIRARINAPEKGEDKRDANFLKAQEKLAADLSRKMDEKFEQLRKQAEAAPKDAPDLAGPLRTLREELAAELSDQLGGKMQELQDSLAERKGGEADEALRKAQEAFAADLSRKMDEKFEQLRKQAEATPTDAPDLAGPLRTLREELSTELSKQLGGKMQALQESLDSLDERMQELLPLKEQAKDEYLKTLKLTAGLLIDRAEEEDELVPAAAMLYTNIEENLIKKFRLRYENKKFVMDYDAYRSLAEEAPGLLSRYDALSPTVLREDEYGDPELVEMLPQVRFYEAGLSVSDSLTARDYWCFLNKLRHKSPENDAFLRRKFLNFAQEKKYLAGALAFFRAHGLYTKE